MSSRNHPGLWGGRGLAVRTRTGWSLAHVAAANGHPGVLRVLHELGVSLVSRTGWHRRADKRQHPWQTAYGEATKGLTPADVAAMRGHPCCLRVLVELGAGDTVRSGPRENHTASLLRVPYPQHSAILTASKAKWLYRIGDGEPKGPVSGLDVLLLQTRFGTENNLTLNDT